MHRAREGATQSTNGVVIERGVGATGRAAASWLHANGFDVVEDPPTGRVFADVVRSDGLTVARMWHSFSRLRTRDHDAVDDLAITLVLEGSLGVVAGPAQFTVAKGEGYLRRAGVGVTLETGGSTGTIEIALGEDFERRFELCGLWGALALPATGSTRFLVASSNAFLSAFPTAGPGWHLWMLALEAITAGTLLEAGRSAAMTSRAEADIVRQARRIIHERCTDQALTVATLASHVSISERRLFEAFAAAGSTPRAEIERARLLVVRRLAAGRSTHLLDWEDVAGRTGFRSSRSLRAALRNRAQLE